MPAVQCNAERLPFPAERFDCVTVAFGLRNMTHKERALAEMARVLRPGGRLQVGDILVERSVGDGAKRNIDLWKG